MNGITNKFIMIFSGALAFIAGLLFITGGQTVDLNFQSTMSVLFVPAIIGYLAIVAAVKYKQMKEGLSL